MINFIYLSADIGGGGGVLMHVYVWKHIVILFYWNTWLILMNFCRVEVRIASHTCLAF